MFEAGLVPPDYLGAIAEKERSTGSPFEITQEQFRQTLLEIGKEHGVEMHVDEEKADVVPTVSSTDIKMFPASMAAMAKVLNHIGVSWSFRTDGFDADNVSLVAGDRKGQRAVTEAIVAAATQCKAKTFIMPECGHSYTEMRWEAANSVGKRLPFRVLHISEYLAECISDGSLKVNQVSQSCTFHDPCQISRRSAPARRCGPAGSPWGRPARDARRRRHELVLRRRRRRGAYPPRAGSSRQGFSDQDETGRGHRRRAVYVSCSGCRQTLEHGGKKFQWNKRSAVCSD